jgi:serine/threonine protein kinase
MTGLDQTHPADLPRFGRFAATAELGAGAMGTVYRAHDDVLGRAVAIKALHASTGLGVRERFEREARAIGALHHPNILAVYDAGTAADVPYLVMELAPGGSLKDRIKAGPIEVEVARALGTQIARALAAAHAAGIVHRDVKPANILAAHDGTWKLADFGIAHTPDSTLTITGQFLGSPAYAAPEAVRAGQFAPSTDVYSLGATLYEALAGTPPFGDHDLPALVKKLEQDPPPLADRVAVPPALNRAIMGTLARDPAARPTAAQLAALLESDETPAPVVRRSRRWPLVAIAIGLVILIAILTGRDDPRPAAVLDPGTPPDPAIGGPPATDDEPPRSLDDEPPREGPPGHGRGHRKHKEH